VRPRPFNKMANTDILQHAPKPKRAKPKSGVKGKSPIIKADNGGAARLGQERSGFLEQLVRRDDRGKGVFRPSIPNERGGENN